HRGAAARRAGRPARARRQPARRQRQGRAALHHGLPRFGARQPAPDDSGDERAAAADGGDRTLGAVQSWAPDLGAVRAGGDRSLVHEGTLGMGKTWRRGLVAVALLALALAGCRGERGTDAEEEARIAAAAAANAAFSAQQEAWRAERHASLVAPDGWTGLIGLYWIELDAHYVGSSRDSGMRLSKGPPRLGLLQQDRGRLFFTPERGVELTVGGEPLKGRIELHHDRSEAPTLIDFDGGLGQLSVIERAGRRALRVRHEEAASRQAFTGIDYWPADPSWRIEGRFIAHPPGQVMEVASIVGGTEAMPNPGVVEFERDGQAYRLE